MVDSSFMPVSRPRRASFLSPEDAPVEDQEMYDWARKNNRLKRTSGSTIIKVADPNAPGGFRYVARNNAETGMTGGLRARGDEARGGPEYDRTFAEGVDQGMPRKVAGDYANDKWTTPGDMASLPTASGDQRGEVIVSSRDRVPSFLSRRAAAPLAADYQKYKGDMLEEKERAKRIAEEDRVNANDIKRYRERKQIDKEFAPPGAKYAEALEGAKIGELDQATNERGRQNIRDTSRRGAYRTGEDIPGLSKRGEIAGRSVVESGGTVQDADAIANRAHEQQLAKIQKLEESGDPDAITEAQKLRAGDPDLEAVPSFIDERAKSRFSAQQTGKVGEEFEPFLGSLKKRADEEDISWDPWNAGKMDPYQDFDADVQSANAAEVGAAVQNIKQLYPTLSSQTLRQMVIRKMQGRFPQDYIDAIAGMIQE